MNGLITKKQELKLYELGWRKGIVTVDEIIDWMRKKFNMIIYNHAAPFVNPSKNNKIQYSFGVKYCNTKWGWNQRAIIRNSKWTTNIYAAKREAIDIAIKWIESQKCKKVSIISRGS